MDRTIETRRSELSPRAPLSTKGGSAEPLCIETQGRNIMSGLVHDVTADAFRLDLYGAPAGSVPRANGTAVSGDLDG